MPTIHSDQHCEWPAADTWWRLPALHHPEDSTCVQPTYLLYCVNCCGFIILQLNLKLSECYSIKHQRCSGGGDSRVGRAELRMILYVTHSDILPLWELFRLLYQSILLKANLHSEAAPLLSNSLYTMNEVQSNFSAKYNFLGGSRGEINPVSTAEPFT